MPPLTGAAGGEAVRRFYKSSLIGCTPADSELKPIARTISEDRVIDEFVLEFTHDCEMPFMLPGVAPTGRRVRIPTVVVMGFQEGKVAYEHIYWDQASVLVQLGLLDPSLLPVSPVQSRQTVCSSSRKRTIRLLDGFDLRSAGGDQRDRGDDDRDHSCRREHAKRE